MNRTFLEAAEAALSTQLNEFATKLPNYATLFGITTGQQTSAQTDADYFAWLLDVSNLYADYSKSVNAHKELLKKN